MHIDRADEVAVTDKPAAAARPSSAFGPVLVPADRVADEELSHFLHDAKIDHLSRGFVTQVADAPLGSPTDLVLGVLKFLPTTGVFGAAALEPSDLSQLLASLPLEAANGASGHDEGRAFVRGHGGQVNFPQVHVRLHRADACSAWGTSMQTCNSKPRFQTSVQASLFSEKSRGKTTRPFSLWTAWAGHFTG
jgi:hypothetical protein